LLSNCNTNYKTDKATSESVGKSHAHQDCCVEMFKKSEALHPDQGMGHVWGISRGKAEV